MKNLTADQLSDALLSLATLANAKAWQAASEQWCFTADLLGEAGLPRGVDTCNALENLFEQVLVATP